MQTDNSKVVTAKGVLRWAGEVLDLIETQTNSDVVIGQVLGSANEPRRGDPGNSSYPIYPDSRPDWQG
jgi:hypothetical protein